MSDQKSPREIAKQVLDNMYLDSIEIAKMYTTEERMKLAKKGHAMPDGSYPIANVSDLRNAIQAFGRAKDQAAVKAHIKARAKALNRLDLLPENWQDK